MKINVCDYWSSDEGGCFTCPCGFVNTGCENVDRDRIIQELEEAEKNIQKMLDKLRKL